MHSLRGEPLRLETAEFGYRRGAPIDTVSATVSGGELVHLAGPNGVGKSTVLKTLGGLLPLIGGVVGLGEHQVGSTSYLSHVGGLFDDDLLHPFLTASEHLDLARSLYEVEPSSAMSIDHAICEGLAGVVAGEMSSGQRARLGVAMSLVQDPPLWLLDEPWNALDAEAGSLLTDLVVDRLDRGGIVMVTTHHPLPSRCRERSTEWAMPCSRR